MRALWLCNIILPDFCTEFEVKRTVAGGWMTGMLSELEKLQEFEIGLCFPIIDENRLKNGSYNNHLYYSFQCDFSSSNYNSRMVEDFKRILGDFHPDIVHIWGTEYSHTAAMVEACDQLNLLEQVVIHIQGLVSIYAEHYCKGVPKQYLKIVSEKYGSIESGKANFVTKGKVEIEVIKKVRHVIGRTDWDEACTNSLNSDINYHFCNEILRESFYHHIGSWSVKKCIRYSIFVSQATYPIKGLHFLLEAMPILARVFPDIHIYIAGADVTKVDLHHNLNPYGVYLKDLIRQHDLIDKITFLGRLNEEEMIEQYLKANVFISASTIENSPNSVCEAMLLGTPVVSSYVGGIQNLISHNKNGFLYQYDAPYMLAHYVSKVFEDENIAQQLSENAVSIGKELNNRKINSNQAVKIYESILQEANKKRR